MNAIRTTFLLAALTALFMVVGYMIGGTSGMIMAIGFSLVTNLIAYWNADKIVLRLQNAEAVDPRRAPELYRMVEGLSQNAGLPAPKLYLIHTDQPNAFATGRNPQNAAVAVSTGLLRMLDEDEVAGVMAHELAHIKNRDTLTMTISATLAGAISMLAQFGFFFGGRNNNSPFGFVGALAMMILAPMAAAIVQMAVSRTREYEADNDGAEISGNPLALASALQKISQASRHFENPFARRNPGLAHMYIINPLHGGATDNLFSTHPNVVNRIAALEEKARQMQQNRFAPQQRHKVPREVLQRPARHGEAGSSWRVPRVGSHEDETRGPSRGSSRGPWG